MKRKDNLLLEMLLNVHIYFKIINLKEEGF